MTRSLLVDLDLCIGCKSCGAACTYAHLGSTGVLYSFLREQAFVPFLCRHCERALCVEVCPSKALKRDDQGIVSRSDIICIGCRSCVFGCPFGVIGPELYKRVVCKCDLCVDRLARGEEPACVGTCPSGALRFESPSEAIKGGYIQIGARALTKIPTTGRRLSR